MGRSQRYWLRPSKKGDLVVPKKSESEPVESVESEPVEAVEAVVEPVTIDMAEPFLEGDHGAVPDAESHEREAYMRTVELAGLEREIVMLQRRQALAEEHGAIAGGGSLEDVRDQLANAKTAFKAAGGKLPVRETRIR